MAKFCNYCGKSVSDDATKCPACGKQIASADDRQTGDRQAPVIVNVENSNVNSAPAYRGEPKNKWVSVLLCLCLGCLGAHKFYEGKIGMGILYLFTAGLFGIGVIVDFFVLLFKSNPYYIS